MHITELDLSPAVLVCHRALNIADVDQLVSHTAGGLIGAALSSR